LYAVQVSRAKETNTAKTDRKRSRLTRDDVIAAGIRLLDQEGVGGLSMRALARELDVGPGSVYWQVRDKAELLRLILDDTLRDVVVPSKGSWSERLASLLVSAREVLRPRPVLIPILWNAGWELGPDTLRVAEQLVGLVAESGIPEADVPDAYWTVLTYLLGFVIAETSVAETPRFAGRPDDAAESYPNLVRYAPGTEPQLMDTRFAYGIEQVIAGLRIRAGGASAEPRARTWSTRRR
jgi:TetR/AcrR family transcriptional regulator, tetracycline repressor protein